MVGSVLAHGMKSGPMRNKEVKSDIGLAPAKVDIATVIRETFKVSRLTARKSRCAVSIDCYVDYCRVAALLSPGEFVKAEVVG